MKSALSIFKNMLTINVVSLPLAFRRTGFAKEITLNYSTFVSVNISFLTFRICNNNL